MFWDDDAACRLPHPSGALGYPTNNHEGACAMLMRLLQASGNVGWAMLSCLTHSSQVMGQLRKLGFIVGQRKAKG